ncbi:hypothetical protein MRB53_007096 [Persea americana]|uniref:Uncharacterized protein n=1 Tax=Persea americana TaxID=3435 RepID=A0ACC2MIJ6_PERAE|nr:hypothetical protein MRB53_007096 [Persea americana]
MSRFWASKASIIPSTDDVKFPLTLSSLELERELRCLPEKIDVTFCSQTHLSVFMPLKHCWTKSTDAWGREDCKPKEEEKRAYYRSTASARAELPGERKPRCLPEKIDVTFCSQTHLSVFMPLKHCWTKSTDAWGREDCKPKEEEKRAYYRSTASTRAELPGGVRQFVFTFLTLCQSESRDACRRRSVQRVAAKRTSPFHAFDILLDREYWCLPELIVAPSYTQIKEK